MSAERDEWIVSRVDELSDELRRIREVTGLLSDLKRMGLPWEALRPVVEHMRERCRAVEAGARELREQEDDPELQDMIDCTLAVLAMTRQVIDRIGEDEP